MKYLIVLAVLTGLMLAQRLTVSGQSTLLFIEDWQGEFGTSGDGEDGDGNAIGWYLGPGSTGVSYRPGDLQFNDLDRDVTWSVTIPGNACERAVVSVSISAAGDLEGYCSIGSATCECTVPVGGGTVNTDYVDLYIDGRQVPGPYGCSVSCAATNCPGSCNVNDGFHTLVGDCNNGSVDDAGDWGTADFYETVDNYRNDISIDITVRNGAQSEYINISTITVDCLVLSVEFNDFSVKAEEGFILIKWETASEVNNDYFIIERSTDGKVFYPLGEVDGAGTSFSKKQYQFKDDSPQTGLNYYRIKQVDLDGQIDHSPVQVISYGQPEKVKELWLQPNPAGDRVNISLPFHHDQPTKLEVFNANGRLVEKMDAIDQATGTFALSISSYEPGTYFVRAIQGDFVRTALLVKK